MSICYNKFVNVEIKLLPHIHMLRVCMQPDSSHMQDRLHFNTQLGSCQDPVHAAFHTDHAFSHCIFFDSPQTWHLGLPLLVSKHAKSQGLEALVSKAFGARRLLVTMIVMLVVYPCHNSSTG